MNASHNQRKIRTLFKELRDIILVACHLADEYPVFFMYDVDLLQ